MIIIPDLSPMDHRPLVDLWTGYPPMQIPDSRLRPEPKSVTTSSPLRVQPVSHMRHPEGPGRGGNDSN